MEACLQQPALLALFYSVWNQSFMAVEQHSVWVGLRHESPSVFDPLCVLVRCSRWLLCFHSCDKLLKRSALTLALPVIFLDVYPPFFLLQLLEGGRYQ